MKCQIALSRTWVDASRLEAAIRAGGHPHDRGVYEVVIKFPAGCKVMIDAAIRLLSLANQLAFTTRRVELEFEEGEAGTMGYLNRMGFFDHLAAPIKVTPNRPAYSGAELYRGGNTGLVEIARINRDVRDRELPTRLTDALMRSCGQRADAAELEGAAWTILAELIDNVFSHSQTPLDGYAALQAYQSGDRLTVAVSDSGLGIMETLRPSLQNEFPRLAGLSDVQLLVEVFQQGRITEGALYAHLVSHPHFFAGIDAWWVEPVRHGHFAMGYPFLDLPNVIGSPHNSAGGGGWRDEYLRRAVQNCRRAILGETPSNLIGSDERMR